jgi:signal transduction histidine kinase
VLETNRALGAGDLGARAAVVTNDEIGELARGLNQMAVELQASYETLETRVAQRTEEIQRLLRERTEFFASLSHELRTPIALIINHAETLLEREARDTGRSVDDRAEIIRGSGQQLLAVVNDILDLARLEAGSVRVDISEVSLRDVVDDLSLTMRGLASAADVRLVIDVPPDLPAVRADPARVRDVLLNLVDNAVKYTPASGSVTVSASRDGAWVTLAVSDTGVGIPAEAQDRVFEPFFRVSGTKPQRGEFSTGLGLAIAKKLVEAQSGEIGFTSVTGEGTTFSVRLPTVSASGGKPARRGRADGRRRLVPNRAS